ncbi:50S ribosomal protein mrp49 [Camillea tinctor]|nr:50S ribosomal protein mrp49 [Camillea tinctor]
MVNPGKRMHILKAKLLDLRHGPGAAILPPEITRIHLDFALRWNDGHYGPRYAGALTLFPNGEEVCPISTADTVPSFPFPPHRKFWKICLPRLKYWNPAIPMLVNRFADQSLPATMSIYFRKAEEEAEATGRNALPLAQQPHSSTEGEHPAPPPEKGERVVTIDMKGVHSDAILAEFMRKTGATAIHPTPDEEVEMRQVEELRERGAVDRAIMKQWLDNKRNQERMMALARQEAEAIKMANQ